MGRPAKSRSAVVLRSMDLRAEVRELSHRAAPMFEAAMATGDWNLIAETKALAATLRAVGIQAKRVAGMADALIVCPDGETAPGHGKAA